MKVIDLPCGKFATVSDEDWYRVCRLSWSDKGGGYVRARYKKSAGGDGRFVLLHRFVLAAPSGYVVDHIDGNPLNNTRENLQITTNSRNLMRSPAKRGGVTYDRYLGSWRARLRVDGRMVDFGCYENEADACLIIEEARKLVWEMDEFNVLGTVL